MGEPVDDSSGLHRRAGGVDRGRSGTSAVGYPGHPADRRIRVQAGHFIGTDDLLRLPVSFTVLLIAEIGIMVKAIKKGPSVN